RLPVQEHRLRVTPAHLDQVAGRQIHFRAATDKPLDTRCHEHSSGLLADRGAKLAELEETAVLAAGPEPDRSERADHADPVAPQPGEIDRRLISDAVRFLHRQHLYLRAATPVDDGRADPRLLGDAKADIRPR